MSKLGLPNLFSTPRYAMYLKHVLVDVSSSAQIDFVGTVHPIGSKIAAKINGFVPDKTPPMIDIPGVSSADVKQQLATRLDPPLWFSMLCDVPEEIVNASSVPGPAAPTKTTDKSDIAPPSADRRQKAAEEADSMEEPIDDQQRKADDLAKAALENKSKSTASSSVNNDDDDIEITHVDPNLKQLSTELRFSSEGRFLMGRHSSTTHHDARAINWLSVASDKSQKRDSDKISTDTCALLLFEILEKASEGIWNCPFCAVAIASRCHEMYMSEAPKAGFQDHVNTCVCYWITTQLSRYRQMPLNDEAIKALPPLDFPDVVNRKKGLELNDKNELGK